MKKILVSAFAAVASAAAFAGMNNVVITFSTPGPDKYSDGTTVVDGEKYALVWTPDGETFAGINADGTAAGASKVVVASSLAVGGKCPSVQFQVDEDFVNKNYPGGTWSVVMLDTRKFKVDDVTGKPIEVSEGVRGVDSVGGANPVIGYGVVGAAKMAKGVDGDVLSGMVAASSEVASDTPAPVVKSIDFEGDNVRVWVTATKPSFKYALVSGGSPDAVNNPVESVGGSDYGTEKQDIMLITPKKEGCEFFKVNCK